MLNSRRERMKVGAIKRVNRAMNRLSFSSKSAPPSQGSQMPGERHMGNVSGSMSGFGSNNAPGAPPGQPEMRARGTSYSKAIVGGLKSVVPSGRRGGGHKSMSSDSAHWDE